MSKYKPGQYRERAYKDTIVVPAELFEHFKEELDVELRPSIVDDQPRYWSQKLEGYTLEHY